MVECPIVSRPLVGSSNTCTGTPLIMLIRNFSHRRLIILSDEEVEEQRRGEMEMEEEELDPLWVELKRSAFVAKEGNEGGEEGFVEEGANKV